MDNTKKPIKILITGAAGQISYSLLPMLANGNIFGKDQPIILHLLDIPPGLEIMKGVVLELEDSGYPLLINILATIDPVIAFTDIDVAILIGGFPRREGMDRKDLINRNLPIFKSMGQSLESYAKSTCKVLVVANPANTNCLITLKQCKKIPNQNFTCLTMLDHNRALSQLSISLNEPIQNIRNVVIWGNHSKTQYPDISNVIINKDGVDQKINKSLINIKKFINTVQYRGDTVIKMRKLSSAMSAAKAISDHLRIWLVDGTKENEFISMGIYSDGSYGVAQDIVFSFPCICKNGNYQIVNNLDLDTETLQGIKLSEKELLQEKIEI